MSRVNLDFAALDKVGYSLLPEIIAGDQLDEFEDQIRRLGEIECAKHHIDAGDSEPICAALSLGGDYRTMLFNKIKQLAIVQDMTHHVVTRLRNSGALAGLGIEILTVYPSLKGDLPNEDLFTFPYHQDYKLTRSRKAFRAWIALRDVNRIDGSIEVARGSHRGKFRYETEEDGFRFISEDQIAGRYETEVFLLSRGSGVLFNPLLAHRTAPGKGKRMKLALILHIEDAACLMNPFDANDAVVNLTSS